MLYLFGRLALSDSYYFNDDFQADEHPENQLADQRRPVPTAAPHPVTAGGGGHELYSSTPTKKLTLESSSGLL